MNKEKQIPPKLAKRLLNWFVRDDLAEEVLGDLEEKFYEDEKEKPSFRARLNYWRQVLNYLRPFAIRKSRPGIAMNRSMYRSHFKIGYRNLLRNKWYSLINISSLATGMGVCLVICQYIYLELNYDNFHDNVQNIYRITSDKAHEGASEGPRPYTNYGFGPSAKKEIPEIREYVRIHPQYGDAIVSNPDTNEQFNQMAKDIFFVDRTFLQVFDFPLKLGDKASVFEDKFNMVITEKTALKYFGSNNPIGKVLMVNGEDSSEEFTVSGVIEDLPINSHLQFDFLLPMEYLLEFFGFGIYEKEGGWGRKSFETYVTLDESVDLDLLQGKLDRLVDKYKGEDNALENIEEKIGFQAITDIHLTTDSIQGFETNNGNIQDIRVFSIIAFFILFIAWVNYINLSTARSMYRSKEVGIRKSIGAFRRQLVGQFMMESFLVNCTAAVLSIGIAFLILPVLNNIIGKDLQLYVLLSPMFWMWFLVVIIFGTFLSGLYPAFILSGFRPISMLGSNRTPTGTGNINLRKGLIIFQFLISLLLISGTYLVYEQITFMKNQDLGMDTEKILVIKSGPRSDQNWDVIRSTFQAFREEVVRHPSILDVAGSQKVPGKGYSNLHPIRKLGKPKSTNKNGKVIYSGLGLPKVYGLEFLAGSSFAQDMATEEPVVVVNEEALSVFELGTPENAIGQKLVKKDTFKVIGVVKNFHWSSLREKHAPYLFRFDGTASAYISFNMNLSNIPESIAHIEKIYKTFYPKNPFDYFFLEDDFNSQYKADMQFRNLFLAFSILAIFIACIGLFALVSFSATLKIKEIGIRKILGASTGSLMLMLSKEYLVLLSIAIILAVPAILYWGETWLEGYAFKVGLGFNIFIFPALIMMLISLLTVSRRTYSAATSNPVESLKSE